MQQYVEESSDKARFEEAVCGLEENLEVEDVFHSSKLLNQKSQERKYIWYIVVEI
jgi:hypothetical protein